MADALVALQVDHLERLAEAAPLRPTLVGKIRCCFHLLLRIVVITSIYKSGAVTSTVPRSLRRPPPIKRAAASSITGRFAWKADRGSPRSA